MSIFRFTFISLPHPSAMRFSALVAVLNLLYRSPLVRRHAVAMLLHPGFGEVGEDQALLLLEVCAGVHRITAAAEEFGMPALAMDAPRILKTHPSVCIEVTYSRHMDLMTAMGWLSALQAVRRLRPQGLLWAGCPCSTWIWMSRGSTGRSRLRVQGHKKTATASANKMVRRLCYLILGFKGACKH